MSDRVTLTDVRIDRTPLIPFEAATKLLPMLEAFRYLLERSHIFLPNVLVSANDKMICVPVVKRANRERVVLLKS